MQDGIGRGGYRVLASVFLGIGVLGLVTTLYAFQQATAPRGLFDWLGFGLTFVALIALFSVAMLILLKPTPSAAETTPMLPPPSGRPIDFEFKPEPKEPETGPEVAIPLAAKDPIIAPPNRNLGRDTKGWPRRQPPSGLTMGERKELQGQAVQMLAAAAGTTDGIEFQSTPPRARNGHTGGGSQGAAQVLARPDAPSGKAKGAQMAIRVEGPVSIARVAGPMDDESWNPEGTTKGKCGGCGAMLYAPKERPIHLRCPKCDKLTLLR